MKTLALLVVFLISVGQVLAQLPDTLGGGDTVKRGDVSLRQEMEEMVTESLAGYVKHSSVLASLDKMISRAVKVFNDDKSEENHDRIIGNFEELLAALKKNSQRRSDGRREVNNSSLQQISNLCPLYPFC